MVNSNLYHYAGNNPVKYVDPDGEIAQCIVGAVVGFVSSATINYCGQVISGVANGKTLTESMSSVDVPTVASSGLGGAVTGAITGGLSSIKTVKDAMTMYKAVNGLVQSSANATGTIISTISNNALHGKELDKDLGLNVGLSIGAGIISGVSSPGANKLIESESGVVKESFVKLQTLDQGKTISTINQVSSDNSLREVFISIGQEIAGKITE